MSVLFVLEGNLICYAQRNVNFISAWAWHCFRVVESRYIKEAVKQPVCDSFRPDVYFMCEKFSSWKHCLWEVHVEGQSSPYGCFMLGVWGEFTFSLGFDWSWLGSGNYVTKYYFFLYKKCHWEAAQKAGNLFERGTYQSQIIRINHMFLDLRVFAWTPW